MNLKVLATGANGFVGYFLCSELSAKGYRVIAATRGNQNEQLACHEHVSKDINQETSWGNELIGVDAIVHLAGRAHVLKETEKDPLSAFRKVNVLGTLNLAAAAANAGVKKFIFISSVGVNGYLSFEKPFREIDTPKPHNAYSMSKLEAENELIKTFRYTSLEVVIIRPPLIYGPHVKANFLRLLKLISKGIPLPFSNVDNLRSLVSLDNLTSLIIECLTNPFASGQTFFVSDGNDFSTPSLIKEIANTMGKKAYLFPFPQLLLGCGASAAGLKKTYQQMCGNLQVDINKAKEILGWSPPYTTQNGLKKTVEWYLSKK